MVFLYSILVFPGVVLVLSALLVLAERFLVSHGPFGIDINGEMQLEVEGGVSLLTALYDNEVYIPSACGGQATCGYCKVTLKQGGGEVLPTELPFLSRREIRERVRLACQLKVKENLALRVPDEYLKVQEFLARVKSTRSVTPDIKEVRLELIEPKEIEFQPGQYIQVKCPDPDGDFVFRAYSISSKVSEKSEVELIVRLLPGGVGSTYIHNMKVGDPVTFTGPFGEFVLSDDPEAEVVCVGGGCGMAPIKSIIQSMFECNPDRKAWLFFGCRRPQDVFYLDDFDALKAQYPGLRIAYALSELQPEDQWDGDKGFIHLSVDKHLEPTGKRQAFLCGPPPMIEAVMEVLEDKEFEEEEIFYDKF